MQDKHSRLSLEAKYSCLRDRIPRAKPLRSITRAANGTPIHIDCKLCGTPIQHEYCNTPDYVELRLLFNDHSAHITPLCRACAAKGLDLQTLERLYCSDLLDLADEEGEEIIMAWQAFAYRKPIGFMVV